MRALYYTWGADPSAQPVGNRQDCQLNGGTTKGGYHKLSAKIIRHANDQCERPEYFHSILPVTEPTLCHSWLMAAVVGGMERRSSTPALYTLTNMLEVLSYAEHRRE